MRAKRLLRIVRGTKRRLEENEEKSYRYVVGKVRKK